MYIFYLSLSSVTMELSQCELMCPQSPLLPALPSPSLVTKPAFTVAVEAVPVPPLPSGAFQTKEEEEEDMYLGPSKTVESMDTHHEPAQTHNKLNKNIHPQHISIHHFLPLQNNCSILSFHHKFLDPNKHCFPWCLLLPP
jgi:hypothetical protein